MSAPGSGPTAPPAPSAPAERRAFLSLGSNLGDRRAHLAAAVSSLPDVVAVSPVYETEPVGGPGGQDPYLNCVVELRTTLGARDLLAAARAAEAAAGRVRLERWGPRTLDVDVLLVGDERVDEPDLQVPHPRMWERDFVLVPLADLAPELVGARRPARPAGVRPAGSVGGATAPVNATVLLRREEWVTALDAARAAGHPVGLVPTMGALHGGHLSLIRRAAAECATVGVTIYVNPLQFGPRDDLSRYPRNLEGDVAAATAAGATVVFAPGVEEMWPEPSTTTVHVAGLTDQWEGAHRPGHFDGVSTIVAKLLGLAGRCVAYFGEKDFQQLAVIRRLVQDLSLPVAVIGCPTVREPDGLALSSRNAYLTPEEREVAPRLYWSLLAGRRAVEEDGTTDPEAVVAAMRAAVAAEPLLALDYAAVVRPTDLAVPATVAGEVRLLVAGRLGSTRLIDNLPAISPHPPAGPEER